MKIPWRRAWQPTPVFLSRELHGQRSLAGYSPWARRVGHDWVITLSLSWCIYKRIQRWDGNKHQKIINYKKQKSNNNKKSELSLRFQAWMTKQQSRKRYTSGIWRWKAGILLAIMGWCITGRQLEMQTCNLGTGTLLKMQTGKLLP